MIESLPKKKFWELYNKLPKELQDGLFSDEVGENTEDICRRHGILNQLDFISNGVADVLLGVLPPNEFLESLEKKLGADPAMAKKVLHEVNRFIFFPVKASLELVYNLQMTPLAGNAAPAKKTARPGAYQEPLE